MFINEEMMITNKTWLTSFAHSPPAMLLPANPPLLLTESIIVQQNIFTFQNPTYSAFLSYLFQINSAKRTTFYHLFLFNQLHNESCSKLLPTYSGTQRLSKIG